MSVSQLRRPQGEGAASGHGQKTLALTSGASSSDGNTGSPRRHQARAAAQRMEKASCYHPASPQHRPAGHRPIQASLTKAGGLLNRGACLSAGRKDGLPNVRGTSQRGSGKAERDGLWCGHLTAGRGFRGTLLNPVCSLYLPWSPKNIDAQALHGHIKAEPLGQDLVIGIFYKSPGDRNAEVWKTMA